MPDEATGYGLQEGLPSRTSILVAAARAFGSRDPDPSVRNPDLLADKLIGPNELKLIRDHPLSRELEQGYAEAIKNPPIVLLAGLMLLRTRFIDEALCRAVTNGAQQVVILGAGFDSRAYRFRDHLQGCRVIEVDAKPTQAYKRRRMEAVVGQAPPNLTYASVDLANENLSDALKNCGFLEGHRSFYIWEGVSMYLPETSVRETLRTVARRSAPGSSIALDYANELAIDLAKDKPEGAVRMPVFWGEPWIFGVPGANGDHFFRELGFDPGVPLSMSNPEVFKRYAVRPDGTTYFTEALEKLRADGEARVRAGQDITLPPRVLELHEAIAACGGAYWMAELTVLSNDRALQ